MRRHAALVSLSRDHHHALVIARRLRRATREDTVGAAPAFLAQWAQEEQSHFRVEEDILLPAYAAHGEVTHPAVVRVLLDHVLIRRDALRLAARVEHEARELFPLIEQALPEEALAALGERLQRASP